MTSALNNNSVIVRFEAARNGGVMVRIENVVSFVDRKYAKTTPEVGSWWRVKVVGTNRTGKVNFILPVNQMHFCRECEGFADKLVTDDKICESCHQEQLVEERRKKAFLEKIMDYFPNAMLQGDDLIIPVLDQKFYVTLFYRDIEGTIKYAERELKKYTEKITFFKKYDGILPRRVINLANQIDSGSEEERIERAKHHIAMQEWLKKVQEAEKKYWEAASGPRKEFTGYVDTPLVARDFGRGYDGGPQATYRNFEVGKYLNTQAEKDTYAAFLDVVKSEPKFNF